MILTLTGASGAGKSTIAKGLLAKDRNVVLLTSYTTRPQRETDLPNEYAYLSQEEFARMETGGDFLWYVHVHEFSYGTTWASVQNALNDDKRTHVMVLLVEKVSVLRNYAQGLAKGGRVCSFYILSPSQKTLEERLRGRGDDEATIAKRIKECLDWDEQAKRSGTPFNFITNERRVKSVIDEVVQKISFGDCCF